MNTKLATTIIASTMYAGVALTIALTATQLHPTSKTSFPKPPTPVSVNHRVTHIQVNTAGGTLKIRTQPTTTSRATGAMQDGHVAEALCWVQQSGWTQSVHGDSKWWALKNYGRSASGEPRYVSDTFVMPVRKLNGDYVFITGSAGHRCSDAELGA